MVGSRLAVGFGGLPQDGLVLGQPRHAALGQTGRVRHQRPLEDPGHLGLLLQGELRQLVGRDVVLTDPVAQEQVLVVAERGRVHRGCLLEHGAADADDAERVADRGDLDGHIAPLSGFSERLHSQR